MLIEDRLDMICDDFGNHLVKLFSEGNWMKIREMMGVIRFGDKGNECGVIGII